MCPTVVQTDNSIKPTEELFESSCDIAGPKHVQEDRCLWILFTFDVVNHVEQRKEKRIF